MDGFEVDLDSLRRVVRGMSAAATAARDRIVADLLPVRDALAHDRLGDALAEFGERWTRGMRALHADVAEVGGRLAQTAAAYEAADQQAADAFAAIARGQAAPTAGAPASIGPAAGPTPAGLAPAGIAELSEQLG